MQNREQNINKQIEKAVITVNNGGIIIFPTDTAFGIGCNINNTRAVNKLYEIRKRPPTSALPVLVDSQEMARNYFADNLPQDITRLMDLYWPGGLTIVYYKNKRVSDLVTGSKETIGLRMPKHQVPLQIINKTKVGLAAPSANIHGEKTPLRLNEIDMNLLSKVDYIIELESYGTGSSTVIDCTIKPFKIIRSGSVTVKV